MKRIDNPVCQFIPEKSRKPGVSAFMRIKNGESFLRASILSAVDQVDEIICVYNGCTDNTENILIELEEQYPDKIKVYHYVSEVFPINSTLYLDTPEDSVHSMAHYYNYALSLTNYEYVFKFDADMILFPNIINKFKNDITDDAMIGMRGLNLLDVNQKLYTNKSNYYTDGTDVWFFKYRDHYRFVKKELWEFFKIDIPVSDPVVCFYHFKKCYPDRGSNNLDLTHNPSSHYIKAYENWFKAAILEPYTEKTVFELGFNFINDSRKEYNYKPFYALEEKYLQKYA